MRRCQHHSRYHRLSISASFIFYTLGAYSPQSALSCDFAAMSAQDLESSEYVAESGRRDSASMQGPSHALLGLLQSVQPRIQDWDTDKDTPVPGVAIRAYGLPGDPANIPRSPLSDSSSMAFMDASFTNLTPSLSSGSSTGSDSSIRSSAASSVVRPGPLDAEGCYVDAMYHSQGEYPSVATDRRPTHILCLYQFLGCKETFEDVTGWYEHSKSHLRGRTPPNNLRCPYQSCPWAISGINGEESWRKRWAHLEDDHDVLTDGEALCEKRDSQMFDHLWKARVIDSAQLQELRRSGRLGAERQPYVTTEKPERRRQRPAKPWASRYGGMPHR